MHFLIKSNIINRVIHLVPLCDSFICSVTWVKNLSAVTNLNQWWIEVVFFLNSQFRGIKVNQMKESSTENVITIILSLWDEINNFNYTDSAIVICKMTANHSFEIRPKLKFNYCQPLIHFTLLSKSKKKETTKTHFSIDCI